MALEQERTYTIDDIYALPDGQRAELIDGQMYMMAPPNRIHQNWSTVFRRRLQTTLTPGMEAVKFTPPPFAVFLYKDDKTYVEPDISIICDSSKLDENGCNGAPDWVIEITSPSNPQNDYGIKLFKYRTAGVREYWIVNPQVKSVMVYDLENEKKSNQYTF